MGVLNVTPDSFSDGGKFLDTARAIEHALIMESAGADLLDIGGESTRPGSQEVHASEELDRILPVLEGLRGRLKIPVSVDTRRTAVAELVKVPITRFHTPALLRPRPKESGGSIIVVLSSPGTIAKSIGYPSTELPGSCPGGYS